MPELSPQITYDPSKTLYIAAGLHEMFDSAYATPELDALMVQDRVQALETLGQLPGVGVEVEGDKYAVKVDVVEALGKHCKEYGDDTGLAIFIDQLRRIIPYHPSDNTDRVLAVEHLGTAGPKPVVNEHFQRWLNTGSAGGGFTKEVAWETVNAMALPFGQDVVRAARRKFKYESSAAGQKAVSTPAALVVVRREDFKVHKVEQTESSHIRTEGKVRWGSPELSTLGNCACWAVLAEDYERLSVRGNTKRLYELDAHNVDNARQVLSMLLGFGVMARVAAEYTGTEDILANGTWSEPQVYERATR